MNWVYRRPRKHKRCFNRSRIFDKIGAHNKNSVRLEDPTSNISYGVIVVPRGCVNYKTLNITVVLAQIDDSIGELRIV